MPETSVSQHSVVSRGPRAVYRRLAPGDGAVLLHLDTAAYHAVNEFGALVWDKMSGPIAMQDLLDLLGDELDTAPEGWEQDVRSFLEGLLQRDLIVVDPSPTNPRSDPS